MEDFYDIHDELYLTFGDDIVASVRRLGLIVFRIAMIFTVLRNEKKICQNNKLTCDTLDFVNSMKIVKKLIHHTVKVYKTLPKSSAMSSLSEVELNVYKNLPYKFQRKDAIPMAEELGMSRSTFDRFLKKEYLFKKIKNGLFEKKE